MRYIYEKMEAVMSYDASAREMLGFAALTNFDLEKKDPPDE